MGYDIDNIAPPGSGGSWKPEVGDMIVGEITYIGDLTGDNYDRTAIERKLRIDLDVEGETVSIWPVINTDIHGDGYPKADAKAIAAAARKAGASSLEVGGRLALKRIEDEETKRGMAKRWHAEYEMPPKGQEAPSVDERAETAASLLG